MLRASGRWSDSGCAHGERNDSVGAFRLGLEQVAIVLSRSVLPADAAVTKVEEDEASEDESTDDTSDNTSSDSASMVGALGQCARSEANCLTSITADLEDPTS